MKDKSKLTAIILVIVTVIVVVVSTIINKKNKDNESIDIVTNYSNFYTVNSCLYRVITYLSSNDTDSLLLVLDDNYEKSNNITKDNVLELFSDVEGDSTFVSKKMYYQTLNENITKYYVYGFIQDNMTFNNETIPTMNSEEAYFIVYMDSKNKTFSIEPYSGDIFIGGDINE